jgi:DNA mismatch endonuclease (patch repair protein)
MADQLTPERRSWNMSRIRGKNTKPELLVRRLLHAKGYRYRLHGTARGGKLPGNPDLVFAGRHKVIFVNGCFWHFHDCRVGSTLPKPMRSFGNQSGHARGTAMLNSSTNWKPQAGKC